MIDMLGVPLQLGVFVVLGVRVLLPDGDCEKVDVELGVVVRDADCVCVFEIVTLGD